MDCRRAQAEEIALIPIIKVDEYESNYRPYSFLWEAGKVYFLFGGQLYDKRLAGEADNENLAKRAALEYLERWLTICRAI